jgi:hypothetical protein
MADPAQLLLAVPVDSEAAAASKTDWLSRLLARAQLIEHVAKFRELKCADEHDLEAMGRETLNGLGLTSVEVKRLRRAVGSEHSDDGEASAGPATVVYAEASRVLAQAWTSVDKLFVYAEASLPTVAKDRCSFARLSAAVAIIVLLVVGLAVNAASSSDDDGQASTVAAPVQSPPAPPAVQSPSYDGILSYGFDIDPNMPGFIKKTTQLFRLTQSDVSIASEPRADGETVYSTTESTRAEKLAGAAHLHGGIGPFSAAASMMVTSDSNRDVKTARIDVTRSFNKERATARGNFRAQPHTKLDRAYVTYIQRTSIDDVEDISFDLGIFYARASNLGGQIRKSYTMQVTESDSQTSLEVELSAQFGGLIGGGAAFGEQTTTRSNGATMTTSFHAQGGDTSVWLSSNNLDAIQTAWAESFDDDNLYPWGVELRPIWELVQAVDQAKGDRLQQLLTDKWAQESGAFNPTDFFDARVPCAGHWGGWGSCSASCGGGMQSRSFTVDAAAMYGGSCPHSDGYRESRRCNTQACPYFTQTGGDCYTSDWAHSYAGGNRDGSSGGGTDVQSCVHSNRFRQGGEYDDDVSCTVTMHGGGTVHTSAGFRTESGYDYIRLGGHRYEGSNGPPAVAMADGDTFTWRTDGSVTHRGWELCVY